MTINSDLSTYGSSHATISPCFRSTLQPTSSAAGGSKMKRLADSLGRN